MKISNQQQRYLNTAPSEIPKPHTLEKRKDLPDSKDLPKYISIHHFKRNDRESFGYTVRSHGNFKGKTFMSNKLSMQEKLQLAINYLNSQNNDESLNVQRLDGSGYQYLLMLKVQSIPDKILRNF